MTFRLRRLGRQYESDPNREARRLNRESIHTFRRVMAYVWPYSHWFTISIITLVFSTLLGLVLPLVVRGLVDVVLVDGNLSRLN